MPQPATPPSRIGTVTLTAHVAKEIRDRLKILAVKRGKTMNDLLAEAIDDLFEKHGEG